MQGYGLGCLFFIRILFNSSTRPVYPNFTCTAANCSLFTLIIDPTNEVKPAAPSLSTSSSHILSSPTEAHQTHADIPNYLLSPDMEGGNISGLQDMMDSGGVASIPTPSSTWIKEEDEEKKSALFGDVPEGKRRKFILVDDHARGTRVRVRVLLDSVRMDEMPDSHLRTNSVFPRSYYTRQMRSPPSSPGRHWDDCETDEEMDGKSAHGKAWVYVLALDGSEIQLSIPRMSKWRRQKELALNELGYRMSWSQAKTFNERCIFMQKSRKYWSFFFHNNKQGSRRGADSVSV